MTVYTSVEFLRDLESPYAWPGGYPRYFICEDGECLSFAAAEANQNEIVQSINDGVNSGWRIIGCDINWEDDNMICVHNGTPIESAYGKMD